MNDEICETITDGLLDGRTVAQICRDPGMPANSTVYRWLNGTKAEEVAFQEAFRRALQIRKQILLDEILEIVDAARGNWTELRNENGHPYQALDRESAKHVNMAIAVRQREYDAVERRLSAAAPATPGPQPFNITQVNFMDLPADVSARFRRHPNEPDGTV